MQSSVLGRNQEIILTVKAGRLEARKRSLRRFKRSCVCLDRETPYNRTGRAEGRSSEEASPAHSVAVTKGSQMASGKTFP